jgi:glycosyltransferase involved in cell wall biosynthesis
MAKLKVLVESWFNIPHSYAIVNCFQCIFLHKYFSEEVELYISEKPYFREHWNAKRGLFYTEEYNEIIKSLKVAPENFKPDIVYRATYPYNISSGKYNCPIVVFYTSEFAILDKEYFSIDVGDADPKDYIIQNKNLFFTAPSKWSAVGLTKYTGIEDSRNKIITHGVDTTIYKKNTTNRLKIRELYGIKSDDIVLLNIGAMTQNKGIMEILLAMHILVNKMNVKNIKLVLKGTGDLYECKSMLENYFNMLMQQGMLNSGDFDSVSRNIVFTEQTLTCSRINDLYNACDIYVSPYIAEGFNLTVLESIAAGMKVIVSDKGSTSDFVDNILTNVPNSDKFIYKIKTEIVKMNPQSQGDNGGNLLQVDFNDFVNQIIKCIQATSSGHTSSGHTSSYIDKMYSWKFVCRELLDYFNQIVNTQS